MLADNEYDDVGRLKTNKRNSNPNLITDYSYNIRSWLSSISNPLFSQSLYYQENFEDYNYPRNGGDITAMTWQTASEPQRGYIFNYDGISRLTAAEYLENDMESNKFGVSYSYDKHGNVTELQRYGRTGNESYGLIDNIALIYNGNKLRDILYPQIIRPLNFFPELNTSFTYDRNGNMTKDFNRRISEIQYNSLNLPTKITFNNNEAIENRYVYSATGQKLQVTKQNLSGEHITDYIGSNIYENGSLKRTLIAGGYIEDGQYYYYLTDHLGSTRVVSTASGEVVQTNHYYPYGLTFAEGVDTSNQPYLFNGKEFDRDRSLNLYDYGARFMDSQFGRFTTIDPLSEIDPSVSPYAYCRNNPIRFIDPDGRDAVIVVFPDYKISTPIGKIGGLGHAGVLLINNETGLTKYYEYGRYDKAGRGEVRNVTISDVTIGKDGKPTPESLNKVMGELSSQAGKDGRIDGAYIESNEFDSMNNYATSKMEENSDTNRKLYDLTGNNCGTFASDVVQQDETVKQSAPNIIDPRPNSIVKEFQGEFKKVVYDPIKKETLFK